MDPSQNDQRLDLFDLWRRHYFNTEDLARRSGVSEEAVLSMLRFQPVPLAVARRVLGVIREDYDGPEYDLGQVKVQILADYDADTMDASALAAIGKLF